MKNQQTLKIFLVLILSTAYIFSFSHFGVSAYDYLRHAGELGENTKIGSIDVSGKTKQEITDLLVKASEQWKKHTKIEIAYKESKVTLSNDIYTFQMDATGSQVKSEQSQLAVVDLDSEALIYQLQASFGIESESIDLASLTTDLLNHAKQLSEGSYSYQLENYVTKDVSVAKTIAISKVNVGSSSKQMKELISLMNSLEIKGQSQFSLLAKMDEKEGQRFDVDVWSRLATAIYEVILPTDFTIIERNISDELPSYAKLGMEASINPFLNHDLVFANVNDQAYKIDLALRGKELIVSLRGPSFLHKYEIIKSKEQRYTPKTIKQYNSQLPPNTMKVTEAGKEGMAIKMTRKVVTRKGETIKTEEIADDFYPPVHRVEVHSLKVIVNPEAVENPDVSNSDENTSINSDTSKTNSKDQTETQNNGTNSDKTTANSTDQKGTK